MNSDSRENQQFSAHQRGVRFVVQFVATQLVLMLTLTGGTLYLDRVVGNHSPTLAVYFLEVGLPATLLSWLTWKVLALKQPTTKKRQ